MILALLFAISQAFNKPKIDPKANPTYINNTFEGTIPKPINLASDSSIKEVSGCTFKNINYNDNFFGTSNKEFPFYNNVFEYTEDIINPSIMWFSYATQFTAKSCTFKNLKQNREGILFSANQQLNMRFESCTFINIGKNDSTHYFKMNQAKLKLEMIGCTFSYDNSDIGSKLSSFSQSDLIFDGCTFT